MFGRKVLGSLVVCVCLLGAVYIRAAEPATQPAAIPHLGAGVYEPAPAATDAENARWDWMFINFGHVKETPEGIQEFNRYLALNPQQKYLVRLWPTDNAGLPEYGGQAKFLDYWFDEAVRQKIRDRIHQQIKLVQDNLDKPDNVVGYTFMEEEPGYFGMAKEIMAGSTIRTGSKLPAIVEHYRPAIEQAHGHPVEWNEQFWRWLGERYVASLDDIHEFIRREAPGKLILYWHFTNMLTLDEASFDGFPGTHPTLYPYRLSDIIKKPLCDGIMAYAGTRPAVWEKRYMSNVRKNGWLFFSQLSHPGVMRLESWETALKQANEPLPQNLGYCFFCVGVGDNIPPSRLADPTAVKVDASNSDRFLKRVDEPGHGKVIRISQAVDRVITHAFQWRIPVTAGKTYKWSVSVKTENVQAAKDAEAAWVAIVFDGAKAPRLRTDSVLRLTGDNPWERLSGQVVAPENAATARIYVGLRYATGTVWFDDVSLRTDDDADRELLTNTGFEKGQDSPLKVTDWFLADDSTTIAHWHAFWDEQGIGKNLAPSTAKEPAPSAGTGSVDDSFIPGL